MLAGWSTGWNQHCWETYQQPQICRWYHFTLMAESEEELKSLLIRMREQSERAGLKLNIQKSNKIMGSSLFMPKEGEKVEAVTDYLFSGSQTTVDDDCSHEIKRCFLLWRKAMTNLDSILRSGNITLPMKVHTVKATVFPVVMYWCENWTVKQDEHQRNDAFKLWYFQEKTLLSPLDSKEIKPINPKGYQGDEVVRENHQLNGHEFEQTLGDAEGQGFPTDCMLQSMES